MNVASRRNQHATRHGFLPGLRCERSPSRSAIALIDFLNGDPGMTRTSDLRFRKPPLYPAELRDRCGRCITAGRAVPTGDVWEDRAADPRRRLWIPRNAVSVASCRPRKNVCRASDKHQDHSSSDRQRRTNGKAEHGKTDRHARAGCDFCRPRNRSECSPIPQGRSKARMIEQPRL
jgi:hypothetical protein